MTMTMSKEIWYSRQGLYSQCAIGSRVSNRERSTSSFFEQVWKHGTVLWVNERFAIAGPSVPLRSLRQDPISAFDDSHETELRTVAIRIGRSHEHPTLLFPHRHAV